MPAFGEWNYNYYGSAELVATPTAAAVPFERYAAAVPELEARSDVWFKYSPPPRKPPPAGQQEGPEAGGEILRRQQAPPCCYACEGVRRRGPVVCAAHAG